MTKIILTGALFFIFIPDAAFANLSFQDTPLKEVIQKIQNETPWYFLYRESQIAGIQVTFESTEEQILDDLREVLSPYNIDLTVDHNRYQVLLTKKRIDPPPESQVSIKGQIVDASTGERLPFATLTWQENDELKGVAANSSGRFQINKQFSGPEILLTVSYIGYMKRELQIDVSRPVQFNDLTIRLEPETLKGNDIIISGFTGYNPSDTLLAGMIDASRFSPLGESNSIRALQSHPSVSKGTALNTGMNIRGSTPDGFLVILDGMSIFNQSHLFGLLDSFNADAIQSSGYYFGVTPANIDTPTGGTLNLITRTGSLNEFRNRVGVSNTSFSGTFEGPLVSRSSWLISARSSYMDHVNWFNNPELIQWGLDIDRPRRLVSSEPDFTDLVLRPGPSSAQFLDLHGKIYYETSDAGRIILSGYFGGDRTSHKAERRTRSAGSDGDFIFEPIETFNEWGNALLSIKFEQEFFDRIYSSTTAGISTYETEFEKDDFLYSRVSQTDEQESITIFTYPFRNRSSMNELKVNQEFEYIHEGFRGVLGGTWRLYKGEYGESSFDRPSFYSKTKGHLADVYIQTGWNPIDIMEMNVGGRYYYYSPDDSHLIAPRLQIKISPLPQIQLTGGYSVNHQFLHRVSLENATTADVWILSTENQPPASSNQFSAGIEISPFSKAYLKVEAYQKTYDNLRIHELNTQTLENTFSGTPWFFQNSGESKGIETILRNRWGRFTFTQSYSLSEMKFRNPFLLDGEEFFADWDRTHTFNSVLATRIGSSLQIYLSWLMMSGAPNSLATFGSDNKERLDPYYRLDTTLSYQQEFRNLSRIDIRLSIFNLLNRDNVWYRYYAFNFDETRSIPRLRPVPVDVLDLGFQPSFRVKYSF